MMNLASSLNRYYFSSVKHSTKYVTSLICVLLVALESAHAQITLDKIHTLFLPNSPAALGGSSYTYPSLAIEFSAYDTENHIIYTVGQSFIRVIDARDQSRLREVGHMHEEGAKFSSILVCGDYVVTTLHIQPMGKVVIYEKITGTNPHLKRVHSITVGPTPDHVAISRDCRTMVIALEGEAFVLEQTRELVDPEGGVGVLHFPRGMGAVTTTLSPVPYIYARLNFTKFNPLTRELINRGVRFIFRIKNNTLSRDLEPEYSVLSDDERLAYVVLQENNAIATVNLTDPTQPGITDISPLGYKNWNASNMDASDKDGYINLSPHPIYGMFQPDGMAYKTVRGVGYIFTANEGDVKLYPQIRWTELKRGKAFIDDGMISNSAAPDLYNSLYDKTMLGRLQFTMDDGEFTYKGLYSELYTFGARSFSIFRAEDMSLVYDSGDHIERSHATHLPRLFNADSKRYMNSIEATTDRRSDNKGPECESLILAEVYQKTLIFVGNERPGTISIYSLTNDVTRPQFESVNYGGQVFDGQTWQQAYENRNIGDIDPESLIFVPANQNPSGQPILIVTGAVSGTVSIYAIKDGSDPSRPAIIVPPPPPTQQIAQHVAHTPKQQNPNQQVRGEVINKIGTITPTKKIDKSNARPAPVFGNTFDQTGPDFGQADFGQGWDSPDFMQQMFFYFMQMMQ